MLTLKPDEIHVWLLHLDASDGPLPPTLRLMLSTEERNRAARFRRRQEELQFECAHVLLRSVLSRYFDVHPSDWAFARDSYGKPRICAPQSAPLGAFSISHTDGLVACSVALTSTAAIDVEKIAWTEGLGQVAPVVFSNTECEELRCLEGQQWLSQFFAYWTLKEAYAKARGQGLRLPLRQVSFAPMSNAQIDAHFEGDVEPDPFAWSFWCWRLPTPYTVALAAKGDPTRPFAITTRYVQFCPALYITQRSQGCCRSAQSMSPLGLGCVKTQTCCGA
jgi:4'-phosphopantetheinyl transferase